MLWWLYTNWALHHRQNHSRMWGCVSSWILCSSTLWVFFIIRPLFNQQRKWAELMHLMEIKSPSKSHNLFYEMQNELHSIVTEQRHRKKPLSVCYFACLNWNILEIFQIICELRNICAYIPGRNWEKWQKQCRVMWVLLTRHPHNYNYWKPVKLPISTRNSCND